MSGNKRGPAAAFAGGMIALAVLAGCASAPGPSQSAAAPPGETAEGAVHHHHGQAPAAPEAVVPGQPAATLSPDPQDAPSPTSVLEAERAAEIVGGDHGGHGSHGSGTYRHVDAGRGPAAEPAPAPHSGHEHGHTHEPPAAAADTVYACPMHPEVTGNAPGKCSKCGMDLVERRKP